MSRIEELIKRKHPGGVEYKPLCEVTILTAGDRIIKSMMSDDAEYPVMGGGDKPTGRYTDYNFEHSATVSRAGSAGSVNWLEGKFWATDVCFVASQRSDDIDIKFVYYYLCSQEPLLKTKIYGGNLPKLNKQFLWQLPIPIIELDTQQEIVRMLDTFTELEAELEAELTKRKQQYEYYRDQLLNFERERERVEWRTIGDLCEICRGVVMSKDFIRDNQGNYPVYSSQTENNGILGLINSYNYDGNYLSWTTDGAKAGTVFRRSGKFNITNVCGLLKIKDESYISFDYLFYVLSSATPRYVSKGMGNAKLMSNVMASIKVPVPPKVEQEKIATMLNQFSSITEDISKGIPAEIEARSKQYVYYRDRLLTFKERVV